MGHMTTFTFIGVMLDVEEVQPPSAATHMRRRSKRQEFARNKLPRRIAPESIVGDGNGWFQEVSPVVDVDRSAGMVIPRFLHHNSR
jgi:hypothetical protein